MCNIWEMGESIWQTVGLNEPAELILVPKARDHSIAQQLGWSIGCFVWAARLGVQALLPQGCQGRSSPWNCSGCGHWAAPVFGCPSPFLSQGWEERPSQEETEDTQPGLARGEKDRPGFGNQWLRLEATSCPGMSAEQSRDWEKTGIYLLGRHVAPAQTTGVS